MSSMNLTVAPTAFVVLAKENIEKRPLYIQRSYPLNNTIKAIVMESIPKKSIKESLQAILHDATQSK